MAKQTVTSVSISDDARDIINDNFTEVYASAGVTTTVAAAGTYSAGKFLLEFWGY